MTEPNMECKRCGKPYPSEEFMVCPCHPMFKGDFSGGGSFDMSELPGVKEAISQAENRGYEKGKAEEREAIETAFKEVRPEDKVKQEKICSCGSYERCNKCDSDSERMKRIGYNDAISDYDQAVKNYLGK